MHLKVVLGVGKGVLVSEVEMCLLGVGKGVPRKMPLPIHYNGEMCMSVSG